MMNNFFGVYGGLVEENRDPEKLGRVKVRVPAIFGLASEIPTDRLPWALPRGLPFGNSQDSGGISWLPAIGDTVWTSFLDGEPEKPLWEWGMGPKQSRDNLKLHEYSETQNGYPDRAILSRFGHSVEFKPEKVTVTTKEGQQIVLSVSQSESGGGIVITTPKGQSIRLNDTAMTTVIQALESATLSAQTAIVNAPTSATIKAGRLTFLVGPTMIIVKEDGTFQINTASGAALLVDNVGNVALTSSTGCALSLEDAKVQLGEAFGTGVVFEPGKASINAPQMVINTAAFAVGVSAEFPVLMLTPQSLAWLMTHTHSNGNEGSPTGPPIVPWPTDAISKTIRTI